MTILHNNKRLKKPTETTGKEPTMENNNQGIQKTAKINRDNPTGKFGWQL